jgi:RNA polymerase sigma factor (sigma-70 family)
MNNVQVELLVKQYKQTSDKAILDKIFAELKLLIHKKAKYIFERKYFPIALYHLCKRCRKCTKGKELADEQKKKVCCEICDDCTCVKGYFNLRQDNLCEYQDVENDLWVEILRIIKDYDITKDFSTYLISSIYEWRPSFLTKDFVDSLRNTSLTRTNEEGLEEEVDIADNDTKNQLLSRLTLREIASVIFKLNRNEIEHKIVHMLFRDNSLTQTEIAEQLCVSQQYISEVIHLLQKKFKILLVKKQK